VLYVLKLPIVSRGSAGAMARLSGRAAKNSLEELGGELGGILPRDRPGRGGWQSRDEGRSAPISLNATDS